MGIWATPKSNKAGFTATQVACGWAEAVMEKVTRAFRQEQQAQKAQKRQKSKMETDRSTDGQSGVQSLVARN